MVAVVHACLALAQLPYLAAADAPAAALECPVAGGCGAGSLMLLQRSQQGLEVLLDAGDFGRLESLRQQAASHGVGTWQQQVAALQEESRRLAGEAVARASREKGALANGTNVTAPRVGTNDSAQASTIAIILDKLNNTIIAGMLADHEEDQREVRKQMAFITDCHARMLTENQTNVAARRADANAKAGGQRQCQATEVALRHEQDRLCREAHQHFKGNIATMDCVLGDQPNAPALKRHLDCVREFADRLGPAEAEYWKCSNATMLLGNKSAECILHRDGYDSAQCAFETTANDTCNTYASCYVREVARYESVKKSVQAVEAGRKVEAVSVAKIRCYLGVIDRPAWQLEGDAGVALLRNCDGIDTSTEEHRFDIAYPSLPGSRTCALAGEAVELPAPASLCPSRPVQPVCDAFACPLTHLPVSRPHETLGSTPDACCTLQPSIAADFGHSLFLDSAGRAWAAGENKYGSLGIGSSVQPKFPVRVPLIPVDQTPKVYKVACGMFHSLFLLADGAVWAAGYNFRRQLGDGTTVSRESPVRVKNVDSVVDIASGLEYSLFLIRNGTVWGTGDNRKYQLGVTNGLDTSLPWRIAGVDASVEAVVAGYAFTLFRMVDGTLMGCGENNFGQLGLGTARTPQKVPIQFPGLAGVVQVSAHLHHVVVLLRDGSVRTFGYNTHGQIGDGTTRNSLSPVRPQGIDGVASVAASGYSTFFGLRDGSVMATGFNGYGELADGSVTTRTTPVVVKGMANVTRVFAGKHNAFFLQQNGTVRASGVNGGGQLGDGTRATTGAKGPVNVKLASGMPLNLN